MSLADRTKMAERLACRRHLDDHDVATRTDGTLHDCGSGPKRDVVMPVEARSVDRYEDIARLYILGPIGHTSASPRRTVAMSFGDSAGAHRRRERTDERGEDHGDSAGRVCGGRARERRGREWGGREKGGLQDAAIYGIRVSCCGLDGCWITGV